MNQFKNGDVVRLKSGGPKMTVENIARDATGSLYAWCVWFDTSGRQGASFNPDALEPA